MAASTRLADLMVEIRANMAPFQRTLQRAENEARSAGGRMASVFTSTRAALAGTVATLGFGALSVDVIKTTSTFDNLKAALKTVTGSAGAAQVAFDRLMDFAGEAPGGVEEVIQAFIRLKGAGLDPSIAALRSYGNTAAAMGKPMMQFIEAVTDAATGEFERLKEFNITASSSANDVAFTFQNQTTVVKKNASEVQKYLLNIGNTKYAGAMAEQAKAIGGALSNASDSIDRFKYEIGRGGLAKEVISASGELQKFLDTNQDLAHALGDSLAEALRLCIQAVKDFRSEAQGTFGGWLGEQVRLASRDIASFVDEIQVYMDRLRAIQELDKDGFVFFDRKNKVDDLMKGYALERQQRREREAEERRQRSEARKPAASGGATDPAADPMAASTATNEYSRSIKDLIDDLNAELAALGKTSAEQAVLTNLKKAGVDANSKYGQEIRRLTLELERQNQALKDGQDDLRTRQQFQAAQQDIALLGAGTKAAEAARYAREKLFEIERQAAENGPEWAAKRKAAVEAEAQAWGSLQEKMKQAELAQDAVFERAQLGRTESERRIYSQFNSAGLLDANGQISGVINERIAEQMRWNHQIEQTQDAFRGVGREITDALAKGDMKGAGKAILARFQNMIADQTGQMIDDSINAMISKVMGGGPLNGMGIGKLGTASNPMAVTIVGGMGLSSLTGSAGPNLLNQQFGATKLARPGDITRASLPKLLSPDASSASAAANAAPNMAALGSSMSFVNNYRRGVDPRLTEILDEAAKRSGYKVEAFSGFRPGDPRFHGKGMATDVRLIDPDTGKAIPNYQNAGGFRAYEQYAQTARQVQMERYPGLDQDFRWGGYFGGPRGKYGAMDTMHFDLGGRRVGMGGGSWANGLTPQMRAMWPGAQSQGMGQVMAQTQALQQSTKQVQDFTANLNPATQGLGTFGQGLGQFGNMLGSAGGGGGANAVGGIFSLFSSFAGMFDGGGEIGAGKWGIAGEHGAEVVRGPASVIGRRDTLTMMRRPVQPAFGGGRSGPQSVRGGDIIVHGNVDKDTMPDIEAAMKRQRREMAEQQRYEKNNSWRFE